MAVEPVFNPKGEVQLQSTKNDQLVLSRRKLDYLRDAMNLGTLIVENICLLVAPYYFTWNAFWGFLALTFLTNYIGTSLSYHRNLSHKSFKLPKSLEYLFAYFGLHAAQGGKRNNVMDLQNQAYYRFLRTTYPLHIVGLALVLYFAGGLPHLIWGMGFTWGKRPWNPLHIRGELSVSYMGEKAMEY
ncbi:icosanoyl-CoA 5-desaturase-like isoform X1 [Papaver somniferum]|uniref:icosanoyl-CoA 5-desaturase-like isoform X1 n=1 Tax=Papaver somniferum TaxID=3469 RepID=UPI000E704D4B|nr:icosanoyl-CoA 5-desaturase-like isoform X1 [Papaver somniferum]